MLQDKEENLVYSTEVILPPNSGIIRIALPSNVPPLEIGKTYNWYFKILCKPNSSQLSSVNGWIQRTSLNPSLENQLKNATLQQKVALYASNGIWYEALTAAAELRRTNSKDPNWSILLQDVGLSEIAQEAIAENPVLTPSEKSNQSAAPKSLDNFESSSDQIQPEHRIFAVPPPPPDTGAPAGRSLVTGR